MKRLLIIPFALAFLATTVQAQEVLTLEDALAKALQNNHQVQILQNQKAIAQNSATAGNAGLLPSVTANASYGVTVNNTALEFAGGLPPTEVDGAQSSNAQAGVSANYVLFDGLRGPRQYQRLKLNAEAVDAQSQAAIEATMLQVANAYFVLARAIDQERIAEENVTVSQRRYERAQIASDLGTALRTELLAARVDMTTDSSALLTAQLQRKTAQRNLERLMVTELPEGAATETLELSVNDWTAEQLLSEAQGNNATLKNAELQMALAEKDYQLSWASAFPTLSLNGGFSYSNQQSEAGIVLSNTATGWNGSVALSYPLFNGFRNRTTRQNQEILLKNSQLELENQELQLAADINNAFDTYEQSITLAEFEQKNLEAARLNLQRMEELYKTGNATSVQFREAQVAYASSQVRISNALISVKLNELEIVRLTGQILSKK